MPGKFMVAQAVSCVIWIEKPQTNSLHYYLTLENRTSSEVCRTPLLRQIHPPQQILES
jgi:hypothetical protein